MALSLLPFGPSGAPRIVDLGAGTGLMAALIRNRLPRARLHLVDIAEGMLDQARARFAGDAAVTFMANDIETCALPPAEAYVSALAIHHLGDGAKQALFRRVFAALEPGGVFINVDQAAGRSLATDRAQHAAWLSAVRAAGTDAAQLDQALGRMAYDRNATLDDQLAWMEAAGFAEVDLWFKQWFFCVYAGRKPH
jgi:tRNA (cmo5U34)-methyltransferase